MLLNSRELMRRHELGLKDNFYNNKRIKQYGKMMKDRDGERTRDRCRLKYPVDER